MFSCSTQHPEALRSLHGAVFVCPSESDAEFVEYIIEGNTLTLKETAFVLEGISIDQKPLKDYLEAVGHRDAFFYVQQLVENKVPITEKVIKEIHSLVLIDRPEGKGVYRKIPVRIMGAQDD